MLRTRYTTPDGSTHQSTLTSTWTDSPIRAALRSALSDRNNPDKLGDIHAALVDPYKALGCEVTSVELLGHSTQDLGSQGWEGCEVPQISFTAERRGTPRPPSAHPQVSITALFLDQWGAEQITVSKTSMTKGQIEHHENGYRAAAAEFYKSLGGELLNLQMTIEHSAELEIGQLCANISFGYGGRPR